MTTREHMLALSAIALVGAALTWASVPQPQPRPALGWMTQSASSTDISAADAVAP